MYIISFEKKRGLDIFLIQRSLFFKSISILITGIYVSFVLSDNILLVSGTAVAFPYDDGLGRVDLNKYT